MTDMEQPDSNPLDAGLKSTPEADVGDEAEGASAVAADGAPALFSAQSLELPKDPESIEFAQALQALKPLFTSRTEYNFMVCEQLALRGVPPNGLNVRKAGSWGAPVAVGSDVKSWYAALSARLSAEHAQIPEAAKRGANALFEQLWELARNAATAPAQKVIEELAAQLDEARTDLARDRQTLESTRALTEEMRATLDMVTAELNAQLAASQQEAQTLASRIGQLQASIADQALAHQVALREQAASHEASLETERRNRQEAERAKDASIQSLNEQLARERERYDSTAAAHGRAVDGFRQDLKEAHQQMERSRSLADQARAVADGLREQLASEAVAKSLLEQRLAQVAVELARANEEINRLSTQIASKKDPG